VAELHLSPEHLSLLRASAIHPDIAAERGYQSLDADQAAAELLPQGFEPYQVTGPGLYLPGHDVFGNNGSGQFRPDVPRVKDGKPIKYETAHGQRPILDVAPRVRERLRNPAEIIFFTEGARKADALVSLGFCAIALSGVWNWRAKVPGTNATAALGDFDAIPWQARRVVLMFDSDARSNSNVRLALERLGEFLRSRGAAVEVVLPPEAANGGKQGIDDYLALGGDFAALWTLPENIRRADDELFDSWEPIDLSTLGDREPVLPNLAANLPIFYPGKRHVFSGLPEALKTMLAYAALLDALRNGRRVGVLNFEMDEHDARDMFRDLGATEEEVAQIVFRSPERAPTSKDITALVEERLDVVLIDAGAGMYEVEGVDDNDRIKVEKTAKKWIKPLWRAGIATATLDHLAKKNAGGWAIGSERKVGQADVHLRFQSKVPLVRGGKGVVKITVEKDRPGYIRRDFPHGLEVFIESDPITHALTYAIRAYDPDEREEFRPTGLMEKVSKYVEKHDGEPKRKIIEAVGGKRDYVLLAIDTLEDEGYVEFEKKGQSMLVHHVRPFTEHDDIFTSDDEPVSKPDDTCPMCGASGDEHCRTKDGKLTKTPHKARPHS
jgi:hypothetical protein